MNVELASFWLKEPMISLLEKGKSPVPALWRMIWHLIRAEKDEKGKREGGRGGSPPADTSRAPTIPL